jgi:hypothetical protein
MAHDIGHFRVLGASALPLLATGRGHLDRLEHSAHEPAFLLRCVL